MTDLTTSYSPVHIDTVHGVVDNQTNMNPSHKLFREEILTLTTTTKKPNISNIFSDGEIKSKDIHSINVQDVIVWCMYNDKALLDSIINARQKNNPTPNITYRDTNYTISLKSGSNTTLNAVTLNTSMADSAVVNNVQMLISMKKEGSYFHFSDEHGAELHFCANKKKISELIITKPLALHKILRAQNVGICASEAYEAYK